MFKSLLKQLPKNIAGVFKGYNWVWHLIAITLTYILVRSGFDWWYFEATRSSTLLLLTLPAAVIGFFVPIILPVALYIFGEFWRDVKIKNSGSAVAQAGIIAWLVSSTYKAFTGRIQPEFITHTSTLDISREFNFGFFQHGIFWGWPSSHTAVAFAGTVALVLLYPHKKIMRSLALLYAIYIGLAVSVSIHWFSDFVAGAIIGTVVGYIVAKSFKSEPLT